VNVVIVQLTISSSHLQRTFIIEKEAEKNCLRKEKEKNDFRKKQLKEKEDEKIKKEKSMW
jgi:hypothetical protein